jgi:hypothetical protein
MEVSMEAAAVLLSLAMRDTETPVAELCNALSRIGGSLAELRAGNNGDSNFRKQLASDIAVCIESLQFHDRLIQQLAAVRGLLASVAADSTVELKGFGAHRWEDLLSMLRDRLNADSQHHLFNLLLRTGIVAEEEQRTHQAADGSIELF